MACLEVLVARDTIEVEDAVVRQGHLIAVVVRSFPIGCAALLVVGCAGTRSETSKKEQGSSPQATASEEARCEGTRTYRLYQVVHRNGLWNGPLRTGSEEDMKKADKKAGQSTMDFGVYTTNDLPGCPKGGLLLGTDKPDKLDGREGDDEIRGLGGSDHYLDGGPGSDTIYGGDSDDGLHGFNGEDALYGGDGNDLLTDYYDEQRDKLYCGEGRDEYVAVKNYYVDSSCEKKLSPQRIFGGAA